MSVHHCLYSSHCCVENPSRHCPTRGFRFVRSVSSRPCPESDSSCRPQVRPTGLAHPCFLPGRPDSVNHAAEVVEVFLPQLPTQGLLELLLLYKVRKLGLPRVSAVRLVLESLGRPLSRPLPARSPYPSRRDRDLRRDPYPDTDYGVGETPTRHRDLDGYGSEVFLPPLRSSFVSVTVGSRSCLTSL